MGLVTHWVCWWMAGWRDGGWCGAAKWQKVKSDHSQSAKPPESPLPQLESNLKFTSRSQGSPWSPGRITILRSLRSACVQTMTLKPLKLPHGVSSSRMLRCCEARRVSKALDLTRTSRSEKRRPKNPGKIIILIPKMAMLGGIHHFQTWTCGETHMFRNGSRPRHLEGGVSRRRHQRRWQTRHSNALDPSGCGNVTRSKFRDFGWAWDPPRKQSTFGWSGMAWRIQRDTGFSSVRLGVHIDFFPSTPEKNCHVQFQNHLSSCFIMKQLKDGADYYLTKLSSHKNTLWQYQATTWVSVSQWVLVFVSSYGTS